MASSSSSNAIQSVPCPFDPAVVLRVRYGCSCGCPQPLSRLYLCRHCLDVRCPFCVSHEVDSHYCPNCLENMPSAEARLKRNRCANCFDCPVCGHTLSTRATSVQAPSAEDPSKTVPKKVYYLACAFCRWTSRDIGLKDQNVASGGWPDQENPHNARLSVLQDHYRMLAQKEKLDKESKRFVGRKLSYMQLSDKYGLSAAVARRRAGMPPISSAMTGLPFDSPGGPGTGEGGKQVEPSPSEAKDISEVEVLPEELFTDEVDLCATTSLEQRLLNVDLQAESVGEVFPRHKHLMIKRSQRCRKCEHNLSKPEYNPSSIKFKIQLAAFYHVPEVVILAVEGVVAAGAEVVLVVKVVNPTQNATAVSFHGLEEYDLDRERRRVKEEEEMAVAAQGATPPSGEKGNTAAVLDLKKKLSTGMLRSSASLVVASDIHKLPTNADLVGGPTSEVMIPPRDDAAEFDDAGPAMVAADDDKNLVRWRRANKVGVALKAKIGEATKKEEEAVLGVTMKFVYTNTISALEQREVQKADICLPIFVKLGTAA